MNHLRQLLSTSDKEKLALLQRLRKAALEIRELKEKKPLIKMISREVQTDERSYTTAETGTSSPPGAVKQSPKDPHLNLLNVTSFLPDSITRRSGDSGSK